MSNVDTWGVACIAQTTALRARLQNTGVQ